MFDNIVWVGVLYTSVAREISGPILSDYPHECLISGLVFLVMFLDIQ